LTGHVSWNCLRFLVAFEGKDMVAWVGAGNVGDVGCSCKNLETQATSVDDLEFSGCRSVLVAECVHQAAVLFSVRLRFDCAEERYFGLNELEKSADAADPSVLDVIQGAFEDWRQCPCFLLDPGNVDANLHSKCCPMEDVSPEDVDAFLALEKN
jgi:hypothetical protein